MSRRAILRPDDILSLVQAITADMGRFGIWVAEDKYGEAQGFVVTHRTRDNPEHGQIELAWLDPDNRADDKVLDDLQREILRWARANKLKTIGAMTMRDTPAMESVMKKLGMMKTDLVYYGRTIPEKVA